MKVNIDQTIEITDEQRVRMACVLDQKQVKRVATRAEMKEFMWEEGAIWSTALDDQYDNLFGPKTEPAAADDMDLI